MKRCIALIFLIDLNLGIAIFLPKPVQYEMKTKEHDHSNCDAFLEHMKRVATANHIMKDYKIHNKTITEISNPNDFKSQSWEQEYGSSDETQELSTFLEWTDYPNKTWVNNENLTELKYSLDSSMKFKDLNFATKEDQLHISEPESRNNRLIQKLFLINPKISKNEREFIYDNLAYTKQVSEDANSQTEGTAYINRNLHSYSNAKNSTDPILEPFAYRADKHSSKIDPIDSKAIQVNYPKNDVLQNSSIIQSLVTNGYKTPWYDDKNDKSSEKINQKVKSFSLLDKPIRWTNEESSFLYNSFLDKEEEQESLKSVGFDINALDVNDQVVKDLLDVYLDLLKPIHVLMKQEKQAQKVLNILKTISTRKINMPHRDNRRQFYSAKNKIINAHIGKNKLDILLSLQKILDLYNRNLIGNRTNIMVHFNNLFKMIQNFFTLLNIQYNSPDPKFMKETIAYFEYFLSLDVDNVSAQILVERHFILWMIDILAESIEHKSVDALETDGYVSWVLRELFKNSERINVIDLLFMAWKFVSDYSNLTDISEKNIVLMVKKLIPDNPAIKIDNPDKVLLKLTSILQNDYNDATTINGGVKKSNIEPEIQAILNIINKLPTGKTSSVLNFFSDEIQNIMSELRQPPYHDEAIKRNLITLYGLLQTTQNGPTQDDKPYKTYSEIKRLLTVLKQNIGKDKSNSGKVNKFISFIDEQLQNNNGRNSVVIQNKLNEILSQPKEHVFINNVLKQLNTLISTSDDSQKKRKLILTFNTLVDEIVNGLLNNAPKELKQVITNTLLNSLEKIKSLPALQTSASDTLQQLQQILSSLMELPINNEHLNNLVWLVQQAANEVLTDAREKNIFELLKNKVQNIVNVNLISPSLGNDYNNNIRNPFNNILVLLSNEQLSKKDGLLFNEAIRNIKSQQPIDDKIRQILNRAEIYLQNLSKGLADENNSYYLADDIEKFLTHSSNSMKKMELSKLIYNVMRQNRFNSKNRDLNNILIRALLLTEQYDDNSLTSENTIKSLQKLIELALNIPTLDWKITEELKTVLKVLNNQSKAAANKPLKDGTKAVNIRNNLIYVLFLLTKNKILPEDEIELMKLINAIEINSNLDKKEEEIILKLKTHFKNSHMGIGDDSQLSDIIKSIANYIISDKTVENSTNFLDTIVKVMIDLILGIDKPSRSKEVNDVLLDAIKSMQEYTTGQNKDLTMMSQNLMKLAENLRYLNQDIIYNIDRIIALFDNDSVVRAAHTRNILMYILTLITNFPIRPDDVVTISKLISDLMTSPNLPLSMHDIVYALKVYLSDLSNTGSVTNKQQNDIAIRIENVIINNKLPVATTYDENIAKLIVHVIRKNQLQNKKRELNNILLKVFILLQYKCINPGSTNFKKTIEELHSFITSEQNLHINILDDLRYIVAIINDKSKLIDNDRVISNPNTHSTLNILMNILVLLSNDEILPADNTSMQKFVNNLKNKIDSDNKVTEIISNLQIYMDSRKKLVNDDYQQQELANMIENYVTHDQAKTPNENDHLIKLFIGVVHKNREKNKNRELNNILLSALLNIQNNNLHSNTLMKVLRKLMESALELPNLQTDVRDSLVYISALLKEKVQKDQDIPENDFQRTILNSRKLLIKILILLLSDSDLSRNGFTLTDLVNALSVEQDPDIKQINVMLKRLLINRDSKTEIDIKKNIVTANIHRYLILNKPVGVPEQLHDISKHFMSVIRVNSVTSNNKQLNNIIEDLLLMLQYDFRIDPSKIEKTQDNIINGIRTLTDDENLDEDIKNDIKYIKTMMEKEKNIPVLSESSESNESSPIDQVTTNDDIREVLIHMAILFSNQEILPNDKLVISELLNNLTFHNVDPRVKTIINMTKSYLSNRNKETNYYQRDAVIRSIEQYLNFIMSNKPSENLNQHNIIVTLLIDIVHKNRETSKSRDLNDKILTAINILKIYDKVDLKHKKMLLADLQEIIKSAMLLTDLQKNIIDDLERIYVLLSDVSLFDSHGETTNSSSFHDTIDVFIRDRLIKIMILLAKKDLLDNAQNSLRNIVNEIRNKPNIKNEVRNIISMLNEYLKNRLIGMDEVIVNTIEDYLIVNKLPGASQHYVSINKFIIDVIRHNRKANKNEQLNSILLQALLKFQYMAQSSNDIVYKLNDLLELLRSALKISNLPNVMVKEVKTIIQMLNKTILELDISTQINLTEPRYPYPFELPMKMQPMQFEDKNGTEVLEILFKLLHKKNEAGIDKEIIKEVINLILAVKKINNGNQSYALLTPIFGFNNLETLINILVNFTVEDEELTEVIQEVYQVKQAFAGIEDNISSHFGNIIKYLTRAFKENNYLDPSLVKKIIFMIADVLMLRHGNNIVTSAQYMGSPKLIYSLLEVFNSNHQGRRGSSSQDVKLLVDIIDLVQQLDSNTPAETLPPINGVSANFLKYLYEYLEEAVQFGDVKNKTEKIKRLIDIIVVILHNNAIASIDDTKSLNKNLISAIYSVIKSNDKIIDTSTSLEQFIQVIETVVTIVNIQNEKSILRLPPILGTNLNFIQLLVKLFDDKKYQDIKVVRNIINLVYEKTEQGKVLRNPLHVFKLVSNIFGKENFGTAELLDIYPIFSEF